MDGETELPASDPRLLAADLTEEEFVGDLQIHEHTGMDFLDAYRDAYGATFSQLPCHPLIRRREGYTLHYDSARRKTPLAFLGYKNELIGVFESDNLTVDNDHQGKGLGSELILAGYAQARWKNMKERKVTEAGAATLLKAYRLAKEAAKESGGKIG
jgi:GNAT superfamily N-acetyltransferase